MVADFKVLLIKKISQIHKGIVDFATLPPQRFLKVIAQNLTHLNAKSRIHDLESLRLKRDLKSMG
ncbi:hypothetical protein C2R72_00425 [Helicobacter pylori]|uniref:Uncharacterized protein n=1 Tax=Helicobacter pylori TaxID=210 RepID=A0A2T6VYJ2_HELPX|nr:hypothetical protein C2R72_00425 [Helicobacter pylori]